MALLTHGAPTAALPGTGDAVGDLLEGVADAVADGGVVEGTGTAFGAGAGEVVVIAEFLGFRAGLELLEVVGGGRVDVGV